MNRMFARDYLSLKDMPQIKKLLEENKEPTQNLNCYSDYMIRINSSERKERRIILVTGKTLQNLRILSLKYRICALQS